MAKKVEETSNNAMSAYYGTTFLLFVALAVNCIFFWVSFKDIECIAEDPGPIAEEEPEEEKEEEAAPAAAAAGAGRRLWDTLNIMSLNKPRVL